jgi:hypothetical protein
MELFGGRYPHESLSAGLWVSLELIHWVEFVPMSDTGAGWLHLFAVLE